ncbi:MAG: hypothetical protein LLF92_12650, partial [Planctomycetaceae bacterium]|nr:hypothetical protein [Planctomycetaceae bacterium]
MFKNMKLATKMSMGFGVLVAIAGILGYVGWMGLTNLSTSQKILEKDNECLAILDICAKTRRDFTVKKFEKDEKTGKTAVDEWLEAFEQFTTEITSLANTSGLSTENKDIVNNILNTSKGYKETFEGQVEVQKMKDDAFTDWGKIGDEVAREIADAKTKVLDPARKTAQDAKDADSMIKWAKVDDKLNSGIVSNFLLTRLRATYLCAKNTEAQYNNYVAQLNVCMQVKDEFAELVRGNGELEQVAAKIGEYFAKYEAAGANYHKGMEAYIKADKDLADYAVQMVTLMNTLQSNLKKHMEILSTRTNTLMITMALCGIVLGVILAYFITRSIVRPIGKIIA